jgi:hypothetical protein
MANLETMSINHTNWVKEHREYLIQQSEMLQNIITRMSHSSLTVKQVGLTVWAAIVGFGFTNKNSILFIGEDEQWVEQMQKQGRNFLIPDLSPNFLGQLFSKESVLKSWANLPYLITLLLTIVLLNVPLSPD